MERTHQSPANKPGKMDSFIEMLKSQSAKLKGAAAILAVITTMAISKPAHSQTMINKNKYELILDEARKTQETIGEDMAKYIYGGEMQKFIQQEIEKQNSKHGTDLDDEFSLFNNESVQNMDAKNEKGKDAKILLKKDIKEAIYAKIKELATKDFAAFYIAFHNYQKSAKNLVGFEKGKGAEGWNLMGFPVEININYNGDLKLPYSKRSWEAKESELEKTYFVPLSAWKALALENTTSEDAATYESRDLINLETKREECVTAIIAIVDPEIDETIDQYYGTENDQKETE